MCETHRIHVWQGDQVTADTSFRVRYGTPRANIRHAILVEFEGLPDPLWMAPDRLTFVQRQGVDMVKPLSEDPNVEMTYKGVPLPQRVIEHWTSSWGELWREGVDNTLSVHDINVAARPKQGNVEVFDTATLKVRSRIYWVRRISDDRWFFVHSDGEIHLDEHVPYSELKSFGYEYIPASEFPDGEE